MTTGQLRKKYLEFFQKKEHKLFRSDSLVPKNDPTLLFTSAGMNQFKDYFLGIRKDVTRATSCQKCLRTGDLERVGQTAYHHTFFEMLGNFSFGDYFKKEAILWGWEFVTQEMNLKEKDLWITVYQDDNEAYDIWKNVVGISEKRLCKLGANDNFWPQNALEDGPNGPCGPCSEIYFDRGEQFGPGDPGTNSKRFVEFWNLVFTQYNRIGLNQTEPLPAKNIDTGMGLERMASILQGKMSNYEIDILAPLVAQVKNTIKSDNPMYLHAVTDHLRAVSFSIADGIYPSNEDRGYVVRKILRRAVWFGFTSGKKEPFLYSLVPMLVDLMKDPYQEIKEQKDTIVKVIHSEEERFLQTLDNGKEVLYSYIKQAKQENRQVLTGQECFKLYDTYGFPMDLTNDIVKQEGLGVDKDNFEKCLSQAKETSRQSSKFEGAVFVKENLPYKNNTEFVGYEKSESVSKILAVIENGKLVKASSEKNVALVLDKTPFYPAMGGQANDLGEIIGKDFKFLVEKVEKIEGTILHWGFSQSTPVQEGVEVTAAINIERRNAIRRAHTATHLLQAALRKALGAHVQQQGSAVDEDILRFDFNHFKGLSQEELADVALYVNQNIQQAHRVDKLVMDFKEAKEKGALAFFEEKYEDKVRVISIVDISRELCGGTHLDNTAEALMFVITSEGSVASGIRRIEALVGKKAFDHINQAYLAINNLSKLLKTDKDNLERSIVGLAEENKRVKRDLENKNKEIFEKIAADKLVNDKIAAPALSVIIFLFDGDLRWAIELLKKKSPDKTVIVGYTKDENKVALSISRTDDLKEINCKDLSSGIAGVFGGNGGGKDNFAFCGFKNSNLVTPDHIKVAVLEALVKLKK